MNALPPPLDALSEAEQRRLAGYLELVTFAAGTTIFEAGAAGDGCYLLDEGVVRLDVPLAEVDTDATLDYLEAGEVLGELALLDAQPRSVAATAETRVRARKLSEAALERLAAEEPAIAIGVLRVLGRDVARKLRETNDRLTEHLARQGRDPEVEDLVARAKAAQEVIAPWDEDRVDALLRDLSTACKSASSRWAEEIVEVTRIGNVADKTFKNVGAAEAVFGLMTGRPGIGPLGPPDERGVQELAHPMGVIFGLIPVTNPIATAIFKTLSALKSRNSLILSFHRNCLPLAESFGAVAHDVLERHGAPTDLVLWVRNRVSRQKTARFMAHPDVAFVLATGGPGMVRAAYSSGTPAIGVGPGNTPTWIAADADVDQAADAIVASKAFDNGLICGAEHNLLVDRSVKQRFVERLEAYGAAVLSEEERERFLAAVIREDGQGFRPEVLGQTAALMASFLQIERPYDIRILVFEAEPDLTSPVTSEKMSPFLSLFEVDGDDDALGLSAALLGKMGAGHTAIVHTEDRARAERFAAHVRASRILVNSPGSQGVSGVTTGLEASFTLGCGTFGGTSTTDNITYRHLRNVKYVADLFVR